MRIGKPAMCNENSMYLTIMIITDTDLVCTLNQATKVLVYALSGIVTVIL